VAAGGDLDGLGRHQGADYVCRTWPRIPAIGRQIADGVDFSLFSPGPRRGAAALGVADGELAVLFGGHPDNQVKGYTFSRMC
jgi:hypothetical protein